MKAIIWILIVGLVVVLLMINWPSNNQPKINPTLQRSLDSSDATRPDFMRRRDSLTALAVLDTAIALRTSERADSLARIARRARARADSLARTGREWQAAYDARTEEARQLDSAYTVKDSAWRAEREGRIHYQQLATEEEMRRRSLEKLNSGLRVTINSLERPCRLVGPVPCPNRWTVAVLSVIGGYFAGSVAPAPIRR